MTESRSLPAQRGDAHEGPVLCGLGFPYGASPVTAVSQHDPFAKKAYFGVTRSGFLELRFGVAILASLCGHATAQVHVII